MNKNGSQQSLLNMDSIVFRTSQYGDDKNDGGDFQSYQSNETLLKDNSTKSLSSYQKHPTN